MGSTRLDDPGHRQLALVRCGKEARIIRAVRGVDELERSVSGDGKASFRFSKQYTR
jgi:hypothetical protein